MAGAAFGMLAVALTGCSLEAPFGDGGEGSLSISTEINGETSKSTRAVPENNDYLRENCVVFLENSRGVMRKYKGLDNIPATIRLSSGQYTCNAWSGDSVPASFSQKFYRGKQEFTIEENQNTSLAMKCNIANVVVSVDPASLQVGLKDMKVTFSTTRGELAFDESYIPEGKGYFMTPSPEMVEKDAEEYARNTAVSVKVSGTKEDGSAYEYTQVIKDVKRAHEYCVLVKKNEGQIQEGGALIQLVIKDIPIIEDTVEVFTAPSVKGIGYNIADQVISKTGFKDTRLYIRGYFGLSSVLMNFSDNFTGETSGRNILDESVIADLSTKGILVERRIAKDGETDVDIDEVYITFGKAWLNALAQSDQEYVISFEAVDSRHLIGKGSLRLVNTDAAVVVEDPVVADEAPDTNANPMAILGTSATLTGRCFSETAVNFGIEYRAAGTTTDWTKVAASTPAAAMRRGMTRATGKSYTVKLTGLQPGTTYEYRAYSDDFSSETIYTFTTESKYIIPNASMEDWSTYKSGTKNIVFAGTGSQPSFWDSGNEGAAMANKTLTNKSTDMKHSGSYSARLGSSQALGILAAGNLFVGDFEGVEHVSNGMLALGRQYNGSHPSKLRVYANYRPGKVDCIKSGNESYLDFSKGDNDHGQIYVALTNGTVPIRTYSKQLFNPDGDYVIAYGQVTWKEAFGPDGQLQMIEIPLEYKQKAQTVRPTHLVITCCASKFGDYFSGSGSSVLYLDDFELVYE